MNLIEGTMEQAIDALVKRAADLGARPRTFQEKQAAGMSDFLGSLGQQVQANPTLGHTLLGGAVGAGLGGAATAFGNSGKDPSERRSVLSSMLTGGLAGGAIGGGASLAHRGLQNIRGPQDAGNDATPTGTFSDASGQRMQIPPEALRNNPQLASRVRQLTEPQNPVDRGIASTLGNASNLMLNATGLKHVPWLGNKLTYGNGDSWLDRNIPTSANVLPKVGLLDALSHMPGLNLGERLPFGRVRPEFSTDVNHLITGLTSKNLPEAIPEAIRKAIAAHMPNSDIGAAGMGAQVPQAAPTNRRSVADILASLTRKGPSTDAVLNLRHTPTSKITEKIGPPDAQKITESLQRGAPELATMNRGQLRSAVGEGVRADANLAGRGLMRLGRRTYGMPSTPWQVAGRMGLYGMMPAVEYALRDQARQSGNEEELRALIAQHARPVPQH